MKFNFNTVCGLSAVACAIFLFLASTAKADNVGVPQNCTSQHCSCGKKLTFYYPHQILCDYDYIQKSGKKVCCMKCGADQKKHRFTVNWADVFVIKNCQHHDATWHYVACGWEATRGARGKVC